MTPLYILMFGTADGSGGDSKGCVCAKCFHLDLLTNSWYCTG